MDGRDRLAPQDRASAPHPSRRLRGRPVDSEPARPVDRPRCSRMATTRSSATAAPARSGASCGRADRSTSPAVSGRHGRPGDQAAPTSARAGRTNRRCRDGSPTTTARPHPPRPGRGPRPAQLERCLGGGGPPRRCSSSTPLRPPLSGPGHAEGSGRSGGSSPKHGHRRFDAHLSRTAFRPSATSTASHTPMTNVLILGHEVDAFWPSARLVVELDSFSFHRHRAAFEDDRARDARLPRRPATTRVRVTDRRLTTEADGSSPRSCASCSASGRSSRD